MYNVVAVVFLVVGVGAGIVSLATSHWTEVSSTRHYGLLQTCKEFEFKVFSPVLCYNNLERTDWDLIKSKRTIDNDWFMVCLVCHCVAVFSSFVALILWFTTFCHLGTGTRATSIFLAIIAAACYIACIVVWTFKYVDKDRHKTHGWSFWVALGAAVSTPVAVVLMVLSAVSKKGYTLVSRS